MPPFDLCGSVGSATPALTASFVDGVLFALGARVVVWEPGRGIRQTIGLSAPCTALVAERIRAAVAYGDGRVALLHRQTSSPGEWSLIRADISIATSPIRCIAFGRTPAILISRGNDSGGGGGAIVSVNITITDKSTELGAHSTMIWRESVAHFAVSPDQRFLALRSLAGMLLVVRPHAPTTTPQKLAGGGGVSPAAAIHLEWSTSTSPVNVLLGVGDGVARLWVEMCDGPFAPVSKHGGVCAASLMHSDMTFAASGSQQVDPLPNRYATNQAIGSSLPRLIWLALIEETSGDVVIVCVEGALIWPRPAVRVIEYYRVPLPCARASSPVVWFASVAMFTRPESWLDQFESFSWARPLRPASMRLTWIDAEARLRAASVNLSASDVQSAMLSSTGGHRDRIIQIEWSPLADQVATRDTSGIVCLWQTPGMPHMLSRLERSYQGEGLALVAQFPGPFISMSWHPSDGTLLTCLVRDGVVRAFWLSGTGSVVCLGDVEGAEGLFDFRAILQPDRQLLFVAATAASISLHHVVVDAQGASGGVEQWTVMAVPVEFGDIHCFACDMIDQAPESSTPLVCIAGIVVGGTSGHLLHWFVEFDATLGTVRTRGPISIGGAGSWPPVDYVAYSACTGRIIVARADTITIWEIATIGADDGDPAGSRLIANPLHRMSAPLPLAYCTLGDGFLRIVTGSAGVEDSSSSNLLELTLHTPNRDHILREHEFTGVRWTSTAVSLDVGPWLPSAANGRSRSIGAMSCSPAGTLIAAVDSLLFTIPDYKLIVKDDTTAITPVPLYHPSQLTELLMTGHTSVASTIVALTIQSIVSSEAARAPALPLGLLLEPSMTSANPLDLSAPDLTVIVAHITEHSMPLLKPPENLQLVAVANTIVKLGADGPFELDDCGYRFLVAVRLFQFEQHAHQAGRQCLESADIAWAVHSRSEQELVRLCFPTPAADWKALSALGIGFWVTSVPALQRLLEGMARSEFLEHRNPIRVMVWYLALGKKVLFLGLLKSSLTQRSMWEFFSHDFREPRWREAAIKNAFEFVATRKFLSAVAMFLLAESLPDAINICVRSLCDPQLALVICRLAGLESLPNEILHQDILPVAVASHDHWLQHNAFWLLGRHDEAVECLIDVDLQAHTFRPDVLALLNVVHRLPPEADTERLILHTALAYAQRGWPFLALRLAIRSMPNGSEQQRFNYQLRLRLVVMAAAVRATSPTPLLSDDIAALCARFRVSPAAVDASLERFVRIHRMFHLTPPALLEAARVLARLCETRDPDLGHIHRTLLFGACRIVRSAPSLPSVLQESVLWTSCFLASRAMPNILLQIIRSQLQPATIGEILLSAAAELADDSRVSNGNQRLDGDGWLTQFVAESSPGPMINAPFSDHEIIALTESLLECVTMTRFLEMFQARCIPVPQHPEYAVVCQLSAALTLLCDTRAAVRIAGGARWPTTTDSVIQILKHSVREALAHCFLLSRSGVSLDNVLAPLRPAAPGGSIWADSVHQLAVASGAQRIATCIADDIVAYCAVRELFDHPIEVFRVPSDLAVATAINRIRPMVITVAVGKSLRQINVESALRFRTRSMGSNALVDSELSSWEGCLHRFDQEEERPPCAFDEFIDPVPYLRAFLATKVQRSGRLPTAPVLPVPLTEALSRDSNSYRHFMSKVQPSKRLQLIDTEMGCTALASHPTLPFYLSGSLHQRIHAWEFDRQHPIAEFTVPKFEVITSICFEHFGGGSKFCATSSNGYVSVFSFDPDCVSALQTLEAHEKSFASEFLDCSSIVATAGFSAQRAVGNVRIWDLLLPPDVSLVSSLDTVTELRRGATALAHVPARRQLAVGTASGHICVFDLRSRQCDSALQKLQAHQGRVSCLIYDATTDCFLSGGVDGSVKIWDAITLQLVHDCGIVFEKQRFFNHYASASSMHGIGQSFGVTSLSITEGSHIICSGTNGSVKWIKRNRI